jgi:hypothetical protein
MHRLEFLVIAIFVLFVLGTYISFIPQKADAAGYPRFNWDRPIRIVPIAWCGVAGSPAVSSPNTPRDIPSAGGGSFPPPTTTDLLIRDRHVRANYDVWIGQIPLWFETTTPIRGAVPTPTNTGIIPTLQNPNISPRGTIVDPAIDRHQYNVLVNRCSAQWEPRNNGLIGINIGSFVDRTGFLINKVAYGGCYYSLSAFLKSLLPTGLFAYTCRNGDFAVVDNRLTFGVPFPDSTGLRDPSEISTAAGLAYALGAHHFLWPGSKFRESGDITIQGTGAVLGDDRRRGFASNTNFNDNELTNAGRSSTAVGGSFLDPPNTFIPGNVSRTFRADKIEESKTVPEYLDLSEVSAELNTANNTVFIGQTLFGLVPNQTKNTQLQYWNFIDIDNNTDTGASAGELKGIGAPLSTNFNGSEIITTAVVYQPANVTGHGWEYTDGNFVSLPQAATAYELYRHIVFPIYGPEINASTTIANNGSNTNTSPNRTGFNENKYGIPLNDMIGVTIDNKVLNITKEKPFNINALTTTMDGGNVTTSGVATPMADILDGRSKGGSGFVFGELDLKGHEPELIHSP